MTPPFKKGLKALADRYDLFIVDLWGTLHDGIKPYRGTVEALIKLADAGKRVAMLSNAPRRAALAEQNLAALGIAPYLYAVVMTSGEAVHAALRDRPDPWHQKLTGACWHLGPVRDRSIFEGLDIALRRQPDGCGFCVATGVDLNEETVEDYRPMLDRALELKLPMICANPDVKVPVGDALVLCAGAFAEYYLSRGGNVMWHGKPHKPIYDRLFAALAAVGDRVDPKRTLAIGDGLPTDILGARKAGLASALVLTGIHRADARLNWRERPNPDALADLFASAPATPDWVLPRLAW